jgi:thiamine monophosphate synthase
MTFWNKKATPDYYPEIRKLTKQCFAVPTTSKETLRIAEEAKKHYIGLSCLYPDASPEENQKRTLLHIWRKDITYTTTH